MDLSELVRAKAYELAATRVGICNPTALLHNVVSLDNMLPGCYHSQYGCRYRR